MINVGDVYVIERWWWGRLDHRYEDVVARVTPRRAYFSKGAWFALDDPEREVKPRHIDSVTKATPKSEGA